MSPHKIALSIEADYRCQTPDARRGSVRYLEVRRQPSVLVSGSETASILSSYIVACSDSGTATLAILRVK